MSTSSPAPAPSWEGVWKPVALLLAMALAQPILRMIAGVLVPVFGEGALVAVPAGIVVAALAAVLLGLEDLTSRVTGLAALAAFGGSWLLGLLDLGGGPHISLPQALAAGIASGAVLAFSASGPRRALIGVSAAAAFTASLYLTREVGPRGPT